MTALFSFPLDKHVFLKERKSGCYQTSSYVLAKNIAELPLSLIYPIIFVCITYWMVGLNSSAFRFFAYMGLILISNFCAGSLGFVIGSTFENIHVATLMTSVLLISLMLVGGFFAQLRFLPWWIKWTEYLSFFRYLYYACLKNDLQSSLTFHPLRVGSAYPGLNPIRGTDITHNPHLLEQEPLEPWAYALILIGFAATFRLISYLVIRFKYHPKN